MIMIKDKDTHALLAKVNKERGSVVQWCADNGYKYHHSKGRGLRVYVEKIEEEENSNGQ